MKIYKKKESENQNFIICSFFTESYIDKANRLIESLDEQNLSYKIFIVPTVHFSKSNKGSEDINYCMPKLILEVIKKYGKPILFVDCDMVFKKQPKLIFNLEKKNIDFAVYNWLEDNENDGYLPFKLNVKTQKDDTKKILYSNKVSVKLLNAPNKEKQLFSSGGVVYFSEKRQSINLLNSWIENIKKYPKVPDDQLLDYTYNYSTNLKRDLKVAWLSKSYCRIYWWIFSEPIINHPNHVTHRDESFFKITGEERFKIENTIKRYKSKIAENLFIDIIEKNIYKIRDNKLILVEKFKDKTYI